MSGKYCENCKSFFDDGNFCPQCGGKLTEAGNKCPSCGAENDADSRFCARCGAKLTASAAPAAAAPVAAVKTVGENKYAVTERTNISYRVKCEKCGEVYDAKVGGACAKCSQPSGVDFKSMGFIQIYRMGHFSGAAAGASIYLNGAPMGYVANTDSVVIAVKPGTYTLHMAIGMSRNCKDVTLTIGAGEIQFYKFRLAMGAWKNTMYIDAADPSDMPAVTH